MEDKRNITNHPNRQLHALHHHIGRAKVLEDVKCCLGFGKPLKKGDEVQIQSTVWADTQYAVAIPNQCGYYPYKAFEVMK